MGDLMSFMQQIVSFRQHSMLFRQDLVVLTTTCVVDGEGGVVYITVKVGFLFYFYKNLFFFV